MFLLLKLHVFTTLLTTSSFLEAVEESREKRMEDLAGQVGWAYSPSLPSQAVREKEEASTLYQRALLSKAEKGGGVLPEPSTFPACPSV